MSDQSLINEALGGERIALEKLLESHTATAVSIAFMITGNRDDALDAAQAGLVRLTQEIRSGALKQSFTVCLYTCVHNAAVDALRQRNATRNRELKAAQRHVIVEGPMTSDLAERSETVEILREELGELAVETAVVLELYHCEELSVADIAIKTGLTVDTCKHRLSRGRTELRQRLERRGIAIASAALIADLLSHASSAGRAYAAEVGAEALSAIAVRTVQSQTPAALQVADAFGATAKRPGIARPITPLAGRPAAARKGTTNTIARAAISGAVAAALIAAICFWLSQRAPQPGASPAPDRTRAAAQNSRREGLTYSDKTDGPAKTGAAQARWTASKVKEGNLVPVSLTAVDNQALLLVLDFSGDVFKTHRAGNGLTLYQTVDGGAHWSPNATFADYSYGMIGFAGDTGSRVGIGLTTKIGDHFSTTLHAGSYDYWQFTQADWIVMDQNGKYSQPKTMLKASPEQPILGPSKLICLEKDNWAFVRRGCAKSPRMQYDVYAGAGAGTECPALHAMGKEAPATFNNLTPPAGWAADRFCAGIVLPQMDNELVKLVHSFTLDGGKTWTDTPVPFEFDTESGTREFERAEPLLLDRDGKRLVLLFEVSSRLKTLPEPDQYDGVFFQYFTVISDDLGRTWKSPSPVFKRATVRQLAYEPAGLAVSGDAILIALNQLTDPMDDQKPKRVVLYYSKNAGDTWSGVQSAGLTKLDSTDAQVSGLRPLMIAIRQGSAILVKTLSGDAASMQKALETQGESTDGEEKKF